VIHFYDGQEEVARVDVPRMLVHEVNGVVARRIELPEHLSERGFVRLRILPKTQRQAKRPLYVIGHLLFDDAIDTARPVSERPLDPKAKAAVAAANRAKAKANRANRAKPKPK
jgi:hypothetical protein